MTKMNEKLPEELFVSCVCGSECIRFIQDDETGEVYVSLLYYNRTDMSISHKLRWIWKIIQGDPYADEVVIGVGWLPLIIDKLGAMRVVAKQIAERNVDRQGR